MQRHGFLLPNKHGEVDNPLRDNVAGCLETERDRRKLRHQHMAKLFQTAPGQGLAYRAYIRTVRKRNNVTLRTLEQMAKALDLSIAIMLSGDAHIEPWAYVLSAKSICTRLANIIDSERECPNLPRHGMAAPVGVSEVTYSKLERATGNISVDTIAGVAKALDLDPPTFFFIEREPA